MKISHRWFLAILLALVCQTSFALTTDPTRPNFSLLGTAPSSTPTAAKNKPVNLQAIMFNNQQKFAIINNQSYQEKQWLNSDTQIIKIMPQAVILNKSGEKQTINLNSVKIKTASKLDGH